MENHLNRPRAHTSNGGDATVGHVDPRLALMYSAGAKTVEPDFVDVFTTGEMRDLFFEQVCANVSLTDFEGSSNPEVQFLRSAISRGASGLMSSTNRPSGVPTTVAPPRALGEAAAQRKPSETSLKASATSRVLESFKDQDLDLSPRRGPLVVSGEARLKINFEHLGKIGDIPQRFGKADVWIPDGVCGTHFMYSQPWRFEIKQGAKVAEHVVVLTWSITNLISNQVTSVTESPKEACVRQRNAHDQQQGRA